MQAIYDAFAIFNDKKLISGLWIVLLLAAFTPSAIRLFVIGSQTVGAAVPDEPAMVTAIFSSEEEESPQEARQARAYHLILMSQNDLQAQEIRLDILSNHAATK